MRELGPQDPGLDRIQPAVVSLDFVIILSHLSVVAQHANLFCERSITRRNRSRLSTSAQVFSRIKAESGCMTNRASLSPPILLLRKIFSPVSLAGVFDHDQAVLPRELEDA